MKNPKKKILIASFFATLMLTVPFTAVGENEYVNGLESEQTEDEYLQGTPLNDEMPGILKFIYSLAEAYVEELLEELYALENYAEMTEAEIANYVTDTLEVISQDLTEETLSEELLISGEEPLDAMGSENTMLTESEEALLSDENIGDEVDLESEDIYLYLAGDVFPTFTSDEIFERLGWVNGVIEFITLFSQLKKEFKDSLIPNVTWVEIIEEGLYEWFGINFDVEQFLEDLENWLLDIFEGKPLIEIAIPIFLEWFYNKINVKVGNNIKQLRQEIIQKLREFIKIWRGKDTGSSPQGVFRKLMIATLKFGLVIWLYTRYMDEQQIQEWEEGIDEALNNLIENWTAFWDWWDTSPWLEPVHIRGNVTGYEQLSALVVYCENDPITRVTVDENGYFEGLDFKTSNLKYPRGLHKCITTACNEASGDSKTLGDSGLLPIDLLNTGAFSGGNLTLYINFSAEDISVYNDGYVVVQSETDDLITPETTEATTQGTIPLR